MTLIGVWGAIIFATQVAKAQVVNQQQKLAEKSFWDNRDFEWYQENIPFFECPDQEIETTYYYRWDLLTKHLTYGSPNSGYSFTEFIDRPFWSGAYGAISCPAGHHLYEVRWLRSPRIARDYSKYWLRTPGAQPRNYSTWLADSVWATHLVHPDESILVDLLPDLIKNYEDWERRHFVPEVGLFWQTGHDDGMEFNINSRQTEDILRGAPSYRPSFNAYMWADAVAISQIARIANKPVVERQFARKADALKTKMVELMWDDGRQFFFPVLKNDEQRDGYRLRALTRTYESGKYEGDPHGRELIGYVPWQFGLLPTPSRFDVAWKKLMDRDGFYADFGPSTVERNDPMFQLLESCCWWSGQSWPFATTQTLKGLANFLQAGGNTISKSDYLDLVSIYARSHRKDGKPYLAEALHPDTGSFKGHDAYNHSEHYFHSGFCDLVITGLVGFVPREDDTLEVRPLAPEDWDYFAMDSIPYRGHLISVVWDRSGNRYSFGQGLHLLVDDERVASSPRLGPLKVDGAVPFSGTIRSAIDKAGDKSSVQLTPTNFAVNNDGTYFPRLTASYTSSKSSLSKVNDGNYWYLLHPPNRWTCEGSPNDEDWIEVDLGTERLIDRVKLYVLDDSRLNESSQDKSSVRAPRAIRLESWVDGDWQTIQTTKPAILSNEKIEGHRPVTFHFTPKEIRKIRATLIHAEGYKAGLTELEIWGDAHLPLPALPHPQGNLAHNDGSQRFPSISASHHDRFGGLPELAIDGITNFLPTPTNRWTSYESPNVEDWLEIDFGKQTEFRTVELAIYDDRGGVQAPESYEIQVWKNEQWQSVIGLKKNPPAPAGSQWNSVTFEPASTDKLRIVFKNRGKARSGVTEVMVWNQ